MHEDDTSRIEHAEVQIGDSVLLLFDREPGWGSTATFLNLYVPDCDETHRRALAAGAAEVTPLSTNAWGDRGSRLTDPFGNLWWVQTHVEDVTEADMVERMGRPEHIADLRVARVTLTQEMRGRAT